ncbi:MAG: hypothetical protein ACFB4I_10500 [Cyanophyceae cyanobacterium]
MVPQILAIRLLTHERQQTTRQTPQDLLKDYLHHKRQQQLPPLAQRVERLLSHWSQNPVVEAETLMYKLEEQTEPDYQQDDCDRLEYIAGYLELVKNGPEEVRRYALERIEQTLLRVHSPAAIAWDFGGVLMDGHNQFFVELYAHDKGGELPQEQLTQIWRTIFKGEPVPGVNYDALKIGQATPEQFARHAIETFNTAFAEIGKQIQITDAEIRHFLTLYYSHYDAKHENRSVLHRINLLGIRQYGLTNNFMAKIEYFLGQHEFDYLQGLVAIVSETFGASKPDPKIYRSFKQHVFLDRFAQEVLGVNFPNPMLHQLWRATFASGDRPDSQAALTQYNHFLKELGHAPVALASFRQQWDDFWTQHYEQIAQQTIFIDDKTRNLDRAFACEGIMGIHYDANRGQTLEEQSVVQELLEQEQLKHVVRTLRELTASQTPLAAKAQQVLERLMPFRIRHEKLIWQAQAQHPSISELLTDQHIYTLIQQHYKQLYTTHFKLGQLVERQYALIDRLAVLPEYTYDTARQVVLELFETSALFLDQNRDLYPWQETEVPQELTADLGNLHDSKSFLKKKLLPELKRKIGDYINALEVSHQQIVQALLHLLHTKVNDLPSLKQFMQQLLQQLLVLQSVRVVPWQAVERCFEDLRQTEADPPSSQRLNRWYHELQHEAQQPALDLVPLENMVAEWEEDINHLESTYFQQYHRWKSLKDRLETTLYRHALLDPMRDQFSAADLYQLVRGVMLRVYDLPRWKDITKPTIVLVSGATGSGKSTLCTHLAQRFNIQKVFSTDEAGRANTKAILEFLFGEEAARAFPGLYQSSFEGSLESYYCQAILTTIGVAGLVKRLHKQNTSALLEGVVLMPGLLAERLFELLNIDWLVVQVERHQHYQHFARRAQTAVHRDAKRYQDHFEMIRCIYDRLIAMGAKHELTMVDNTGAIEQAVQTAVERIKSPLTNQYIAVRDSLRDEMNELLAQQRQHLPIQVRFDVKRAAMSTGVTESKIVELLHRFGFQARPNRAHQWIRQAL